MRKGNKQEILKQVKDDVNYCHCEKGRPLRGGHSPTWQSILGFVIMKGKMDCFVRPMSGLAMTMLLLISFEAKAQCLMNQDCATLGYTKTAAECNGNGIKCPFGDKWSCNCIPKCSQKYSDCGIGAYLFSYDDGCGGECNICTGFTVYDTGAQGSRKCVSGKKVTSGLTTCIRSFRCNHLPVPGGIIPNGGYFITLEYEEYSSCTCLTSAGNSFCMIKCDDSRLELPIEQRYNCYLTGKFDSPEAIHL